MYLYKETGEFMAKVLLDTEDVPRVSERKWQINSHGYIYTTFWFKNNRRKNVKLHQFLLMASKKEDVIDHINRDILDNRKENLRIVDSRINNCNNIKNKIVIPGLKFIPSRGYWVVQIKVNNKTYHIGTFRELENAITIRLKAENIFNYIINKDFYHILDNSPELDNINTLNELKEFIKNNKYGWKGENKQYQKITSEIIEEMKDINSSDNGKIYEIAQKFKISPYRIRDFLNKNKVLVG